MLCFVADGTFHLVKNQSVWLLFCTVFIPVQPLPVWGFSMLLAEPHHPSPALQR